MKRLLSHLETMEAEGDSNDVYCGDYPSPPHQNFADAMLMATSKAFLLPSPLEAYEYDDERIISTPISLVDWYESAYLMMKHFGFNKCLDYLGLKQISYYTYLKELEWDDPISAVTNYNNLDHFLNTIQTFVEGLALDGVLEAERLQNVNENLDYVKSSWHYYRDWVYAESPDPRELQQDE